MQDATKAGLDSTLVAAVATSESWLPVFDAAMQRAALLGAVLLVFLRVAIAIRTLRDRRRANSEDLP